VNIAMKTFLTIYGTIVGVLVFTWLGCGLRTWYGKKYLGETDEAGWE
jgi:hypothetical protein